MPEQLLVPKAQWSSYGRYTTAIYAATCGARGDQLHRNDGFLTIRGEKRQECEEESKNFHRIERSYGSFQRTLSLPEDVNQEAIGASCKNGIVTIILPRKPLPQAATKRIEIKSGT